MKHICPNCGHRTISFGMILSAASSLGAICPSCGVILRMPLWRRLFAGSPLMVMAIWSLISKPPLDVQFFALAACGILMLAMIYISPLEKQPPGSSSPASLTK
jgi:predicted RNA-binding Zn-ribbon protein involved in translation (DUF1610 family)